MGIEAVKSNYQLSKFSRSRSQGWILLILVTLNLCDTSCEFRNPQGNSPHERAVVHYIQTDTIDKSLANIKLLKETGSYFGNTNYSIDSPTDGYLTYRVDSIRGLIVYTFNPKIDFEKIDQYEYLKEDSKNGKLMDYIIEFDVNRKNKVVGSKSFITYSKSGKIEYNNDLVPDLFHLINGEIVEKQKKIKEIEDAEKLEAQKLKEKLDQMDNSDFWDEFDITVKERIYNMIQDKDCNGLQKEFDTTYEILQNFHESNRSSSKHSELLQFIDNKLNELDCYDN